MAIEKSVQETGRSAVMIASGDLSHHLTDDGPYHYSPFGPKFDKRITEIISSGDIEDIFYMDEKETREAGECGSGVSTCWQERWMEKKQRESF